jgi:heptaprenyl diphosphate synthase
MGMSPLPTDMAAVESLLIAATDQGQPFDVRPLIQHLISSGGKRLRPRLVLLSTYASRDDRSEGSAGERARKAAAVVELLHAGTLYHDDVLDEAHERRGVVSANAKWSNDLAVFGGDHLLALASEIASDLGQWQATQLAQTLLALCDGQITETIEQFDPRRTDGGTVCYLMCLGCR